MKISIVVVKDNVANVYGNPMFVANIGSAIRSFGDECNRQDPNNIMNKHPHNFELYELGWYGDGDAHFELLSQPKQIAHGANYAPTVQATLGNGNAINHDLITLRADLARLQGELNAAQRENIRLNAELNNE